MSSQHQYSLVSEGCWVAGPKDTYYPTQSFIFSKTIDTAMATDGSGSATASSSSSVPIAAPRPRKNESNFAKILNWEEDDEEPQTRVADAEGEQIPTPGSWHVGGARVQFLLAYHREERRYWEWDDYYSIVSRDPWSTIAPPWPPFKPAPQLRSDVPQVIPRVPTGNLGRVYDEADPFATGASCEHSNGTLASPLNGFSAPELRDVDVSAGMTPSAQGRHAMRARSTPEEAQGVEQDARLDLILDIFLRGGTAGKRPAHVSRTAVGSGEARDALLDAEERWAMEALARYLEEDA
ncbi:hypothetical protein BD414DRAFT_505922 [Trametes punicea]|nr:hypothetical protein BD414DRAFT_505922 [Trametes punicea]